ncbi:hypothetical protein LTR86_005297 [Recurvomyces mirabilis]|nr:hypothetical protein LTR86_005297 [Recurvomyces mirabilis]
MQLALVLNCNPTKAYWLAYDLEWSADHDFHCASTGVLNLVARILSIVTDIYSIAFPCIVAQGLQVPVRQKIILNTMFGISSITVGAAIARTYLYYKLSFHYDFTWLAFDVYFWTMLEFGLGIICTCAPSLDVFIKKYLSERLSSRGAGGSTSRWTGGRSGEKRQRSESEGELTPRTGMQAVDAHKSSTSTTSSSGITKKSTFEISARSRDLNESHELQTRAGPR